MQNGGGAGGNPELTRCNPDAVELERAIGYKGDMREMDLKEKLIVQRKQKGLSQVQLAEMIHVTRQAVSRWEVGDAVPSIDNLKLLSELYGLPMEYFLNDSMEEPERPEVPVEKEKSEQETSEIHWRWKLWAVMAAGILLFLIIGCSYLMGETAGQEEKTSVMERGSIETNRELDFDWEY